MAVKYFDKLELEGISKGNFENGIILYPWKIQLDAGYTTGKDINMVIITHGHADHIKRLPDIVMNNTSKIVTIVADDKLCHRIDKFLISFFQLNFDSGFVDTKKFYNLIPFSKYVTTNKIGLEQFSVSHSIPTYAYGIVTYNKCLKSEYLELSQNDIKDLVKSGVTVSELTPKKYLLYATDFEMSSLKDLPMSEYQYVIIECTFFFDEHYLEAVKRKHLHWKMIKPYLTECKDTKFILMHMSQRYKDDDLIIIQEMIKSYDNCCLF